MNILLLLPMLQEIIKIDDLIEKRTEIYPCPIGEKEEDEVYGLFTILEDALSKYQYQIEKFGTLSTEDMKKKIEENTYRIDLNYLGDIIDTCNSIRNLCYVEKPELIFIIANDFKQAARDNLRKRLGDKGWV